MSGYKCQHIFLMPDNKPHWFSFELSETSKILCNGFSMEGQKSLRFVLWIWDDVRVSK